PAGPLEAGHTRASSAAVAARTSAPAGGRARQRALACARAAPACQAKPKHQSSAARLAAGPAPAAPRREIRWVDPIAESERHQQLLAEGFTASTQAECFIHRLGGLAPASRAGSTAATQPRRRETSSEPPSQQIAAGPHRRET